MDIEMKIQEKTATFPVWDLKVENGIVPILTDDNSSIGVIQVQTQRQSAGIGCRKISD